MEVGAVCTSLGKTHTCYCSCIDGRGENKAEISPLKAALQLLSLRIMDRSELPYGTSTNSSLRMGEYE